MKPLWDWFKASKTPFLTWVKASLLNQSAALENTWKLLVFSSHGKSRLHHKRTIKLSSIVSKKHFRFKIKKQICFRQTKRMERWHPYSNGRLSIGPLWLLHWEERFTLASWPTLTPQYCWPFSCLTKAQKSLVFLTSNSKIS